LVILEMINIRIEQDEPVLLITHRDVACNVSDLFFQKQ